jgi:hypothetical protein
MPQRGAKSNLTMKHDDGFNYQQYYVRFSWSAPFNSKSLASFILAAISVEPPAGWYMTNTG